MKRKGRSSRVRSLWFATMQPDMLGWLPADATGMAAVVRCYIISPRTAGVTEVRASQWLACHRDNKRQTEIHLTLEPLVMTIVRIILRYYD